MWRNNLHSSQFLAGPIHNKVYQQYFDQTVLHNYQDYIKRANQLQKYLYDLKNFDRTSKEGNNIFSGFEYNLFRNAYGEVLDATGQSFKKGFLRNYGGTNFEKELSNIQSSLQILLNKGDYLTDVQLQDLQGSIILGGDKTKINFPEGQFEKELTQQILKELGVRTKKYLTEEAKKNKSKDQRIIYIKDVQPKIDVATNNVIVSAWMEGVYPNLQRFAKLFSNATITAKNYASYSINTYGVHIGKTQIFRILADFIPTLGLIENRDQQISFQYAIFKRYTGMVNKTVSADSSIPVHFAHIQNIYELMGVGQNYYKKDNTINELNEYLKQGAQFLIINEWNTDNIIVKSTRELLVQIYQSAFLQGRTASFVNTLSRQILS